MPRRRFGWEHHATMKWAFLGEENTYTPMIMGVWVGFALLVIVSLWALVWD